ncbi:histidine kinase dimerization/phosphoacceptor domain -containing protein [uncultured Lutibacter sp.]|uniref:tetratricopeptide repeat-containing sensor histidine kinase n=1 Tax=uncultured Lutibacter sp. TaxID=437739 RepID=UPI00260DE2E8|nr:histidine kinase dimerization/phosphoacceptor domain -containing protein [uncultured Lutibacter sp.]
MKLKLLFIFIFSFSILTSQNLKIDSLKTVLKASTTNDEKIKILEKLNTYLINYATPDNSIEYFMQMATLSNKMNKSKLESRAYKYISECYIKKEDLINAEKFALKAVKISENSNDVNFQLVDFNHLGRVYNHFGKYDKAIETYLKGIEIYLKNPAGNAIATVYSNLGISYDNFGDSENMIKAYLKGAEYADRLKNYLAKSHSLYCIGNAYTELEQFQKAESYYLMALKDSLLISNPLYINIHHHGLGITYSRWGNYKKAIIHNNIALKHYKSVGNKLYEFDVLNNISVVYNRMQNNYKSIEYAKKALNIAKELNHKLAIIGAKQTLASAYIDLKQFDSAETLLLEISKDTIHKDLVDLETKSAIYQNLAIVNEGRLNFKKSLSFFKKFKKANDSILLEKRNSKVTEIETKYQTEQKEKENIQLKAEKTEQTLQIEKEKTQKWLLGGGLGTSIITLFIFGYYYQKNKKQQLLIENLQKELHHHVKNNLGIIDTFIEVAKEEFFDKPFEHKLTELQHRIASINQVHKQLYSNKNLATLNVKKYVHELVTNIETSFAKQNIKIVQHIPEDLTISTTKSFPLGLIINEFLTNAFKYAFEDSEKGSIQITISSNKNSYFLTLQDSGKGLPTSFNLDKSTTFGIRIMKLLSEQLNGTFELNSNNGVQLTIKF